MKKTLYSIISLWLLLVGLSFTWNYFNALNNHRYLAFQTARATSRQILLASTWNITQGKVYVSQTDDSPSEINSGNQGPSYNHSPKTELAPISPAEMIRQLSSIAESQEGIRFNLVGLPPYSDKAKISPWEIEAMQTIKNGEKEVGEFREEKKRTYFRHMSPLYAKKSCLSCHTEQGFKQGDLLGGLAIRLPFKDVFPMLPMASAHFGAGLIGTLLMLWLGGKLNSAYETIRRQAKIDDLTGIPNRRFFSERLNLEFNRCRREHQPLSLIMCDIDHFKDFNDTYGHSVGDKCLKTVAQTIKETLRRSFDFCARYGGEEIVVILPGTPQEGAVNVAERIRSAVETLEIPHKNSSASPFVTLSLGVATDYLDYKSHEELIRNADRALYRGKGNGRNRVEVYLLGEKIHSILKTAFQNHKPES